MRQPDTRFPMTEHDFQQLTLLANAISIADILMDREKKNSFRYNQYKGLGEKASGIQLTLDGHLEGRTLDASTVFYQDMEKAVGKFLRSFHEFKPIGSKVRDSKGRWCKHE